MKTLKGLGLSALVVIAFLFLLLYFSGCRFQPDYVPCFDEIPHKISEKP